MIMVSLIPVVHLVIGLFIVIAPNEFVSSSEMHAEWIGWFFLVGATFLILLGFAISAGIIFAGYSIANKKNHTYCLIISGIECMFVPLGTILGVFSVLLLSKESVKTLFS